MASMKCKGILVAGKHKEWFEPNDLTPYIEIKCALVAGNTQFVTTEK